MISRTCLLTLVLILLSAFLLIAGWVIAEGTGLLIGVICVGVVWVAAFDLMRQEVL